MFDIDPASLWNRYTLLLGLFCHYVVRYCVYKFLMVSFFYYVGHFIVLVGFLFKQRLCRSLYASLYHMPCNSSHLL